jgi:hypothetical protein
MFPIKKSEVFEYNGHRFNSEKEALDFAAQISNKEAVLKFNRELLDSIDQAFIPVYDPESMEIDLFVKTKVENGGNWLIWKSLRQDQELRYYDDKLNVISADEFLERFKDCPRIYLDAGEWKAFLNGIIFVNENSNNPLDWRELIGLVSQMQVSPVTIYSD